MALTAIPNGTSIWAGNQPIPTNPKADSKQSNLYLSSLTKNQIAGGTTEFIDSLSLRFFNQLNAPEIKSLQELLGFVSANGVDPIRDTLNKKEGYFTRLFSNESWADWMENKTPIGKVVSLYCDSVTGSTREGSLLERLNKRVLEVSNRDAARLLQSLNDRTQSIDLPAEEVIELSPLSWSSFFSLPVAEAKSYNFKRESIASLPLLRGQMPCCRPNGVASFSLSWQNSLCTSISVSYGSATTGPVPVDGNFEHYFQSFFELTDEGVIHFSDINLSHLYGSQLAYVDSHCGGPIPISITLIDDVCNFVHPSAYPVYVGINFFDLQSAANVQPSYFTMPAFYDDGTPTFPWSQKPFNNFKLFDGSGNTISNDNGVTYITFTSAGTKNLFVQFDKCCPAFPVKDLTTDRIGRNFIKSEESFCPYLYLDGVNVSTIGFGHNCRDNPCTSQLYSKGYLTLEDAENVFDLDVVLRETNTSNVFRKMGILDSLQLTHNQYNALIDIVFNSGELFSKKRGASLQKLLDSEEFTDTEFSDAVSQYSKLSPEVIARLSRDASFALECASKERLYNQYNGQVCTNRDKSSPYKYGICLDKRVYGCEKYLSRSESKNCLPGSSCCMSLNNDENVQIQIKVKESFWDYQPKNGLYNPIKYSKEEYRVGMTARLGQLLNSFVASAININRKRASVDMAINASDVIPDSDNTTAVVDLDLTSSDLDATASFLDYFQDLIGNETSILFQDNFTGSIMPGIMLLMPNNSFYPVDFSQYYGVCSNGSVWDGTTCIDATNSVDGTNSFDWRTFVMISAPIAGTFVLFAGILTGIIARQRYLAAKQANAVELGDVVQPVNL